MRLSSAPRPSADDSPHPLGTPTLVALAMGYGHLRPAHALAERLGIVVHQADEAPLADTSDRQNWARTRQFYEQLSRISATPFIGKPFQRLLDSITSIPRLHPARDLSQVSLPTQLLDWTAQRGLGRSLVAYLRDRRSPLVATFYAPALIANHHDYESIYCVVTDSDVQRVWVARDPARSRIHYFAPSRRVVARLQAYGVPEHRIEYTGFPLPHSLLGGPELTVLRSHLAARLVRLDPGGVFRDQYAQELAAWESLPGASGPPRLTFAVGGAGAQADLPGKFLPSVAHLVRQGRLRVTLVAGIRPEVAALFEEQIRQADLKSELGHRIQILLTPNIPDYFTAFNALLAQTDILWTKPSELVFFAALGIPLVLSPPVGRHENYNRRLVLENGAGLLQRDPRVAGEWLAEWLNDGTLAAAAWAGYKRLPSSGVYKIVDRLTNAEERSRRAQ